MYITLTRALLHGLPRWVIYRRLKPQQDTVRRHALKRRQAHKTATDPDDPRWLVLPAKAAGVLLLLYLTHRLLVTA